MTTRVEPIQLRIAGDGMKLSVTVHGPLDAETAIDQQYLLDRLEEMEIELTPSLRQKTAELAARLAAGELPAEPVLLAEGIAPEHGRDGCIEWQEQFSPDRLQAQAQQQDDDDQAAVDHYSRTNVISVKEADLLCTIVPPTAGRSGRNLLGAEVAARKGKSAGFHFGQGTVVLDDGRVVATMGGRLHVVGQNVWVNPLLVVQGNVDFESGNVDFDGDVLIEGNVLDLFSVRCSKNAVIRGIVEAARISCAGDLEVLGGINGKQKAQIEVGGRLKARFLDNTTISAGGDVLIQSEMVNSNLTTSRRVRVLGDIKASRIEAAGGVEAGNIGSESGVRATIVVGNDRLAAERLSQVERELESLDQQVRLDQAKAAPLVQRQHAMVELQKVRLIKLLTGLKEAMHRMEQLKKEREALSVAARVNRQANVKVRELIRDGTSVQIGVVCTTLRESLRGPLTMSFSMIDNQPRIVVGSGQGGMLVLDSHEK